MNDVDLTKKKRKAPATAPRTKDNLYLSKDVKPLTEAQRQMMFALDQDMSVVAHGSAGTGKSFIACYKALQRLVNKDIEKIVIIRSAVQVRSVGFLPGNVDEKNEVFSIPYRQIINDLFDNGSAWDILTKKGIVQFINTSFVRGITLDNCFVIIDEISSMNWHELNSVVTRAGENCQMVFCGDIKQTDLIMNKNDVTGFPTFMKVINNMPDYFDVIQFYPQDIVRSGLVKKFIMVCEDLNV